MHTVGLAVGVIVAVASAVFVGDSDATCVGVGVGVLDGGAGDPMGTTFTATGESARSTVGPVHDRTSGASEAGTKTGVPPLMS